MHHDFMLALSSGHLIHPSIKCTSFHAVADVATGTGIWLRDVAASSIFTNKANDKASKTTFVGFDISSRQFPSPNDLAPEIKFVIHDMVEVFPTEYHGMFDLVNVRLVSYALKARDLKSLVFNVSQLLRKSIIYELPTRAKRLISSRSRRIFAMARM